MVERLVAAWHPGEEWKPGYLKLRCVYCGALLRTGRGKGRHAITPLTCGTCSDLPATDPAYVVAVHRRVVEDGDE